MAEEIITKDYGLPDTPFIQKLREQGRATQRANLVLRLLERRCGPPARWRVWEHMQEARQWEQPTIR